MFDSEWIGDLDAAGACEAVRDTQAELREREWREIALAAHWAVLHSPETLPARTGPAVPGAEGVKQLGGLGTPRVTEFACAELAVLMGTGFISADNLMRDALDLAHRHPHMWATLAAGQGRVWKARKVAKLVHAAGLDLTAARVVDAATTPHVDTLPWASFERLVTAEIIAVDPAAAEDRRRARRARAVRGSAGQCDEHGLKTLIARAEAGEVIVFIAMCDRIAQILALQGDTSPAGARRARAIGILAQPATALALLQHHANRTPTHTNDTDSGTGETGEPLCDSQQDDPEEPVEEEPVEEEPPPCPTCGNGTGAIPFPVDPDKLRPKAVLHLRISQEALRARRGVAVLENHGVGPITVGEAIDLLGHCQVTIRPILDLRDQLPVDTYEIPTAMRQTLRLSRPSSVFPWSQSATHPHPGSHTDLDHTTPYLPMHAGGPPGQTRIENLGPMTRFAHRIKTHAPGWRHHQPTPGIYLWRTPHGYWYQVDNTGTRPLGKDPDLTAHAPPPVSSPLERKLADLIRVA